MIPAPSSTRGPSATPDGLGAIPRYERLSPATRRQSARLCQWSGCRGRVSARRCRASGPSTCGRHPLDRPRSGLRPARKSTAHVGLPSGSGSWSVRATVLSGYASATDPSCGSSVEQGLRASSRATRKLAVGHARKIADPHPRSSTATLALSEISGSTAGPSDGP